MAPLRISEVQVRNFRAFRELRFPVDPKRSIVLLYGNNGFGKTSFFDAVEWGLTGKLARYEGAARERNEYGVLRNQFAADREAWVRLMFDDGQPLIRQVQASGHGDYNEGVADNDPAQWLVKPEWAALVDLREAFNLTHLLTQEQVSRFVRSTKDTERYSALVSLFGLGGYEVYSPKLDEIRRAAVQRKEDLARDKAEAEQGIARREAALGSVTIDAQAKRAELTGLLGVDAGALPDLREVQRGIQGEAPRLAAELAAAEACVTEIAYLAQNWAAGESANRRVAELGILVGENQRLATMCHDLAGCKWVCASRDAYSEYRSDPQLVARLEGELGAFLASPLGLLTRIDAEDTAGMLETAPTLGTEAADRVRGLRDAEDVLSRMEGEVRGLESLVATQFGLEKRLVQVARDFLAENSRIGQCPVCTSRIDASRVLQSLEERIRSDSSAIFREKADRLRTLRTETVAKREEVGALTRQTTESLAGLRTGAIASGASLEGRLSRAKKLAAVGESIDRWLAHLQTTPSQIDQVSARLSAAIRASGAYVDGQETKEFYEPRRDQAQAELQPLQQQVVTFNQLMTKHSLASSEGLSQATADAQGRLDVLRGRKAQTDAALRLLSELQHGDRDARSRMEIANLQQNAASLGKQINACQQIEADSAELRAATRRVVEEETSRLLNDYGTTMKRVYTQLNPHVRLGALDFRIDTSNRANNRLVFEAMDSTGKVRVNPAYTFSSAQTNVLAISVFLGIALRQQWSNLNALFLDDPIQNMDDINVHSFVDIIRSVVRDTGKQFFISTHDERVFQFMKRKFRQNVQVLRFTGYGEAVSDPLASSDGRPDGPIPADQEGQMHGAGARNMEGLLDW